MEQNITLYLQLRQGEKVDLATVARAILAFDAAVKEIAFVIDPFAEIKLELESGTTGSLRLNNIVKSVRGSLDKKTLTTIALVVLGWFANDVRSYLSEQAIESVIGREDPGLSKEEARTIAVEVVRLLRGGVGENQVQQVYEELKADDAIQGVGVSTLRDTKPEHIVPRSSFDAYALSPGMLSEESGIRTNSSIETVTLISPVLLPSNRRWRFSSSLGEFGASIADKGFLEQVLSGREPIAMAAGITMKVAIETKEELVGGLWIVRERTITQVIGVYPAPRQTSLPLSPDGEED